MEKETKKWYVCPECKKEAWREELPSDEAPFFCGLCLIEMERKNKRERKKK